MTIHDLFLTNIERCKKWHPGGIEEWSALEWAGAMAGEAGEAANAAKKLKRVESKLQNINAPGRQLIDAELARVAVAEEVADTILYGLLLMARVGVKHPERVIAEVFNRKSEEYGFPERVHPLWIVCGVCNGDCLILRDGGLATAHNAPCEACQGKGGWYEGEVAA